MILHSNFSYRIYFGDVRSCCVKSKSFFPDFFKIKEELKLKYLVFSEQVHGDVGNCIADIKQVKKELDVFNLPGFNKRQLLNRGVFSKNINTKYNHCTMCTPNFYSYRMDNKKESRQATIVVLK